MADIRPAQGRLGRHGAAALLAVMASIAAAAMAVALLEIQDSSIRRMEGMVARAAAAESARAAVERAARSLIHTPVSELGAAGEDGSLPSMLDLTAGTGVRVAVFCEQGKINLNNLVSKGLPSAPDIKTFINLLNLTGLPPEMADALADWMDPDNQRRIPGGAEDEYYIGLIPPRLPGNRPLAAVEEAAMAKGFDPEAMARLIPHVTALPERVRMNVNTATATALAAAVEGLGTADAARIVKNRKSAPFSTIAAFKEALPAQVGAGIQETAFTTQGDFFTVRAEASSGQAWARETQLVRINREKNGFTVIWRRTF